MLRLHPRLNPAFYIGLRRYFLTFCTDWRRRWFTKRDVVDPVHAQILHVGIEMQMEEIAYCFMPDHVHLLVEGCTAGADCPAFVHKAKQRTGFTFAREHGERLWAPSFYDRILRDEDPSLPFIRYIIENPVRAGLVREVEDYRFLGSPRYTIEEVMKVTCRAGLQARPASIAQPAS